MSRLKGSTVISALAGVAKGLWSRLGVPPPLLVAGVSFVGLVTGLDEVLLFPLDCGCGDC